MKNPDIEKISKIHFESFQRILQLKIMLKCLEATCIYNEKMPLEEITPFVEALSQKTAEIENYIDQLSLMQAN